MGPVNYSKTFATAKTCNLGANTPLKTFFSKFREKNTSKPKVTIPRMMLTMIFELAARYHGPKEKGLLAPPPNNHN